METDQYATTIKQPTPEHTTEKLPSALTFFMQTKQRRAVLDALSAFSNDRSQAILIALGLIDTE
ncbi:hypothetical protein COB72_03305 [bacterium]|nr:MAG: hypothetical protein COB72_03305 [bacterium]